MAILGLILSLVLALTLFLTIGLPPVIRDVQHFATELPQRLPTVIARIKRLPMADKFGVDAVAAKSESMASSVAIR